MPRPSQSDSALRQIVQNPKAAIKTRVAALKAIADPSSTWLGQLLSDKEIPSKLAVAVAERLTAIKHKLEVDAILKRETERLAKRDPNKNTQAPVVTQASRSETGQKDAAENAKPMPTLAVIEHHTDRETTSTVPNRSDPRPFFNLPRGHFLDHDEQVRLLELFKTIVSDSSSESQRRGARLQLDRALGESGPRSLFARYLISDIAWLEKYPQYKPRETPAPPSESNPEHELFRLNFSTTRYLQTIAEQERQRREPKEEIMSGGFWDKLPAI